METNVIGRNTAKCGSERKCELRRKTTKMETEVNE